jgi:hypothetical protein
MTRIEAETTIAAQPAEVWRALLDLARWPEWSSAATAASGVGTAGATSASERPYQITLRHIEALGEPAGRVGALRRCVATVTVPLLGARAAEWVEQVTDLTAPWTMEIEGLGRRPLKYWRLRIWLMDQVDGGTRVRCRLTYLPATLRLKVANALFLQRAIERQIGTVLTGLACSFQAVDAPEAAGEVTEEATELVAA